MVVALAASAVCCQAVPRRGRGCPGGDEEPGLAPAKAPSPWAFGTASLGQEPGLVCRSAGHSGDAGKPAAEESREPGDLSDGTRGCPWAEPRTQGGSVCVALARLQNQGSACCPRGRRGHNGVLGGSPDTAVRVKDAVTESQGGSCSSPHPAVVRTTSLTISALYVFPVGEAWPPYGRGPMMLPFQGWKNKLREVKKLVPGHTAGGC